MECATKKQFILMVKKEKYYEVPGAPNIAVHKSLWVVLVNLLQIDLSPADFATVP